MMMSIFLSRQQSASTYFIIKYPNNPYMTRIKMPEPGVWAPTRSNKIELSSVCTSMLY